jgi:hypothetical protein
LYGVGGKEREMRGRRVSALSAFGTFAKHTLVPSNTTMKIWYADRMSLVGFGRGSGWGRILGASGHIIPECDGPRREDVVKV